MKYLIQTLVALLVLVTASDSVFASTGTVILAKGVVTATGADKVDRVLAKGGAVAEGDMVSTAQKSFAVIRMMDNTKLTLKPGTTIAIGKFSTEEGKEEGCINLVKGGLRTVTGLIGKRKPDAFQVDTPIASIGIRGTDFITRICAGDECLVDEQELGYTIGSDDDFAGRKAVADSINELLPEGLYGSCATGAIAISQCAGQVADFELGKCRFSQPVDCVDVQLKAGNAGYAGMPVLQASATPDMPGVTQKRVSALPSVPLIMERDPYFALSDLSDAELDQIDRFPQSFAPQGQCSVYGG
ncbi:FecR family protein [Arenicella xantha]|uniref:FecR family protein n=1 Tax=Arenicella xantha TaxID=644221 RepID=A0A395JFU3_9GAMM|nr:FecR family protein [Arenicella xantha]RBP47152.1 FecR family protein [Arenicella xantha]